MDPPIPDVAARVHASRYSDADLARFFRPKRALVSPRGWGANLSALPTDAREGLPAWGAQPAGPIGSGFSSSDEPILPSMDLDPADRGLVRLMP